MATAAKCPSCGGFHRSARAARQCMKRGKPDTWKLVNGRAVRIRK